jgi:phage head maturation protease
VGLVLDWLPDPKDSRHIEAVRMIEAGAGCSVLMRVQERSTLPLTPPVDVVKRARLVHVCIGHNPAYRGAAAMLFRNVWRDDAAQFAEQLAAVAREARFRDRRGRGHVG